MFKDTSSYWTIFLDVFNAFNGSPQFFKFTDPVGKVYIGLFMLIFKIMLMSLLAAMFINKYKIMYKNIDAYRRFSIIQQKNSVAYDRFVGGITLTFFPFNIMTLPFVAPITLLRS